MAKSLPSAASSRQTSDRKFITFVHTGAACRRLDFAAKQLGNHEGGKPYTRSVLIREALADFFNSRRAAAAGIAPLEDED